MKTLLSLSIVLVVLGTSCKPGQKTASTSSGDDMYYSSSDVPAASVPAASNRSGYEQHAQYTDPNATNTEQRNVDMNNNNSNSNGGTNNDAVATNPNQNYDDSYNADDYYDYEYAARLKRFHNNTGDFGYYDDPYTNSYYYSGDPWMYGSSIYNGYSFWGPSYNMYAYNPSFMWGYSPGFYNPWYPYPHYGFGIGFGYGCGFGYNPWYGGGFGYGGGYWGGYHPGYYNSYYANTLDRNGAYYGPRASANSTGRSGGANNSWGHRVMNTPSIRNTVSASSYSRPSSYGRNTPSVSSSGPRSNANVYSKPASATGVRGGSRPVFENMNRGNENMRSNPGAASPSMRNTPGNNGRNNPSMNNRNNPSMNNGNNNRVNPNNNNRSNPGNQQRNEYRSNNGGQQHNYQSSPQQRGGGGGFRMGGGSSGGGGGGGSHGGGGGGSHGGGGGGSHGGGGGSHGGGGHR
jgi:hypothetical protein